MRNHSIIISHLKNLTKASFLRIQCKDDHLICQSLKHLPSLKVLHFDVTHTTTKGVDTLCDVLSNSQSLEHVELMYDDENISDMAVIPTSRNEWSLVGSELDRLVPAALSCPSLKCIKTNIPFLHWQKFCRVEHHVQHIFFEFSLSAVQCFEETICNCLLSLAEMCAAPSMKSLVIECNHFCPKFPACHTLYSYGWYSDFISILNDSLCKNPSIIHLHLDPSFFSYYCDCLPDALYRDPAIAKLEIARSVSLPDLPECLAADDDSSSCSSSSASDNYNLKHSSSCPDFRLLQSMHNMHPLLYKTLRCIPISASSCVKKFRLYHTNDCYHGVLIFSDYSIYL